MMDALHCTHHSTWVIDPARQVVHFPPLLINDIPDLDPQPSVNGRSVPGSLVRVSSYYFYWLTLHQASPFCLDKANSMF